LGGHILEPEQVRQLTRDPHFDVVVDGKGVVLPRLDEYLNQEEKKTNELKEKEKIKLLREIREQIKDQSQKKNKDEVLQRSWEATLLSKRQ
jgi:hypothetical protein